MQCSCGDRRHLDELLELQLGIAARPQLIGHSVTPSAIRAALHAKRWQRVHRGVYATFTGPLSRPAELWAGVLAGGSGAVLSHESAGECQGLVDLQPVGTVVHVTLPADRRAVRQTGSDSTICIGLL